MRRLLRYYRPSKVSVKAGLAQPDPFSAPLVYFYPLPLQLLFPLLHHPLALLRAGSYKRRGWRWRSRRVRAHTQIRCITRYVSAWDKHGGIDDRRPRRIGIRWYGLCLWRRIGTGRKFIYLRGVRSAISRYTGYDQANKKQDRRAQRPSWHKPSHSSTPCWRANP